MSQSVDLSALLPHPLPSCYNERLLLFAIRRIAAFGLNDAHAAQAMIGWFGINFRRPLLLVRALMAEVSRVSQRRLAVAPCCCQRSTAVEAALIAAIREAIDNPRAAHDQLATLCGTHACIGLVGSAEALAQAFSDQGRPLGS